MSRPDLPLHRYVAFEGIEGAGKSTVVRRVAAELSDGAEVTVVREPGGTPTGERIRSILLDGAAHPTPWAEALLFAAARAQLAAEVVAPALEDGRWVLTDRSVYSSLAYQGGGRGLGVAEVRAVNEPGLRGVWPGVVVLLDVDVDVGIARQEVADRIGGEGAAFLATVATTFRSIAAQEPERFVVIDASGPVDDIVAAVLAHLGASR